MNYGNHLYHYRNSIDSFRDNFDALCLDIDFSENLGIPVKFDPQSMHLHKHTITVHSGFLSFVERKATTHTYQMTNATIKNL